MSSTGLLSNKFTVTTYNKSVYTYNYILKIQSLFTLYTFIRVCISLHEQTT